MNVVKGKDITFYPKCEIEAGKGIQKGASYLAPLEAGVGGRGNTPNLD